MVEEHVQVCLEESRMDSKLNSDASVKKLTLAQVSSPEYPPKLKQTNVGSRKALDN